MQIIPEGLEQALAAAKERRHEVDLHLVHQARRACASAASIPSVTKVNVVPPSHSSGSRA